ncbi:uncharacterized protein PHACADRAFT_203059 [Phanerochaete carnosa HHB-10118-sp]|uniref:Uncharacterized protein n=1 Tax=Phanerochaete carnosa (strain HHB-10118-sp) TaxID=650164 RepID=K5WDJ0_PHACS|nr:uncharacterized protein PHACADRAFT_203059 [Phanerochaete carnosa HHB-10118-sp]EKM48242.1 hypothetical protein PHACADRAFT_203059 [Phanerochaete carnosa HHB-10118-sp]
MLSTALRGYDWDIFVPSDFQMRDVPLRALVYTTVIVICGAIINSDPYDYSVHHP